MRPATLLALLLLAVAAATADAAVTASQITTPSGVAQRLVLDDAGRLDVAGTVTGSGDIDLRCFAATGSPNAIGGSITPVNGTFMRSVSFEDLPTEPCVLRAVPKGTNPPALPGADTPFEGPELAISKVKRTRVNAGPNAGKTADVYVDHVLPGASGEQASTGTCGAAALELHTRPGLQRRSSPWGCNAYLRPINRPIKVPLPDRSQIVVDGRNAYLPSHVLGGELYAGSKDIPGVPEMEVSAGLTGDGGLRFGDAGPALRCAGDTYPPTAATCGSVAPTGVEVRRTTRLSPDGKEIEIVDELRSSDGAEHRVELLYENDPLGVPEVRLPGDVHRVHPAGTRVPLPPGPGSLFVRDTRPPATNTVPLKGALTWKDAPSAYHQYAAKDFQLEYTRTVPAGGSTTIVQVLSTAATDAEVEALAAGVRARLADPLPTAPAAPAVPAAPFVPRASGVGGDLTPPVISGLRLSRSSFRAAAGTTVRWRVSEAARTTLIVERARPGRSVRGRCVAPSRRRRGTCVRFVPVGTVTRDAGAGAQRLTIKTKIGRRKLVPAAYRLRVTATDRAGNRTRRAAEAHFTVVRARR